MRDPSAHVLIKHMQWVVIVVTIVAALLLALDHVRIVELERQVAELRERLTLSRSP